VLLSALPAVKRLPSLPSYPPGARSITKILEWYLNTFALSGVAPRVKDLLARLPPATQLFPDGGRMIHLTPSASGLEAGEAQTLAARALDDHVFRAPYVNPTELYLLNLVVSSITLDRAQQSAPLSPSDVSVE
jgi:hypothetical protein